MTHGDTGRRVWTRRRLLGTAVRGVAGAAALTLAGCRVDDAVTVLAASSLSRLFGALAEDGLPVAMRVSEGASQVLAAQVRAGVGADLVLLADPDVAAGLAHDGLLGPAEPLLGTGLAVAVRDEATRRHLVDDNGRLDPRRLDDATLRLVLADEDVPLRRWTDAGLDAVEPGLAARVAARASSLEGSARLTLAKIVSGQADVAVVYRSDGAARDDTLIVLPWPQDADQQVVITVQTRPEPDEPTRRLLAHLRGGAGPILARHGFELLAG